MSLRPAAGLDSGPAEIRAGGPPFETILIFRVAAPSWFFEGAEGLAFSLE